MKKGALIIIIVLFVIVVVIGIYYFLIVQRNSTKTAYGYSVKDTELEAVREAVSMIKTRLKNPDFIILSSTVGYNSETILEEINKLLPYTKIYGGTSMLATITKDGWHQGNKGSLAMLAISSKRITFGVGGANINNHTSAKEAGKAAIQNAIKNAGKEGKFPQLVLITNNAGNEEDVLIGIEGEIGWGIPIIGGTAGDNDLTGKWKQFSNDKVYSNGVSLTAIFTDLKIAYAYEAGYEKTLEKGVITKANGRIIYEINKKPAAEVYNEWCKNCVSEKLKEGGPVLSETTLWPLAKTIKTETGEHYLSIHPISIDKKDKSLTVFANVTNGDEIVIMHGDWQLLLNRAKMTTHQARLNGNLSKNQALWGIYTFCAGTMLAIPEEKRPEMPTLIAEELGGQVPFIGTFTFGEQGPIGIINYHGNLINSMILFSE